MGDCPCLVAVGDTKRCEGNDTDLTRCEGQRKCDSQSGPRGGWWLLQVPKAGLQDILFSGDITLEFTLQPHLMYLLFLMIFFFAFETHFPFLWASSVFLFEIHVTTEMSWHSIVAFTREV